MNAKATRTRFTRSLASRRGRGFTLIEVVLAGVLSAVIASVCLGFVFTLTRSDTASAQRTAVMVDMSRIHRALQRTFRTMLLDATAPKSGETRQTRISLQKGALGPRMELTLMRPPALGLIDGKAMSPATQNAAAVGALELRHPLKIMSDGTALRDENSLELWWTPYAAGAREAETDQRGQAKGVRIAGSIRSLDVRFVRTGDNKKLERQQEAEVAGWDQVPAYVEAAIEMVDGQKTSWLFEVAAQGGKVPGAGGGYAADADLPRNIADKLEEELATGDNSSTENPVTENPSSPGTGDQASTTPTRDPAAEAQRLREALALAFRLISQLGGGGGSDE